MHISQPTRLHGLVFDIICRILAGLARASVEALLETIEVSKLVLSRALEKVAVWYTTQHEGITKVVLCLKAMLTTEDIQGEVLCLYFSHLPPLLMSRPPSQGVIAQSLRKLDHSQMYNDCWHRAYSRVYALALLNRLNASGWSKKVAKQDLKTLLSAPVWGCSRGSSSPDPPDLDAAYRSLLSLMMRHSGLELTDFIPCLASLSDSLQRDQLLNQIASQKPDQVVNQCYLSSH